MKPKKWFEFFSKFSHKTRQPFSSKVVLKTCLCQILVLKMREKKLVARASLGIIILQLDLLPKFLPKARGDYCSHLQERMKARGLLPHLQEEEEELGISFCGPKLLHHIETLRVTYLLTCLR
jgi:hypothetical protein